jgi:hypothetical protein
LKKNDQKLEKNDQKLEENDQKLEENDQKLEENFFNDYLEKISPVCYSSFREEEFEGSISENGCINQKLSIFKV